MSVKTDEPPVIKYKLDASKKAIIRKAKFSKPDIFRLELNLLNYFVLTLKGQTFRKSIKVDKWVSQLNFVSQLNK